MPLFRHIYATLCIYIGGASAGLICPSNVNFRIEESGKYLTPGIACVGTFEGCDAFFGAPSSTPYEYTIVEGTSSLKIAAAPPHAQTGAGLYADAAEYTDKVLGVMFNTAPPVNMNCSIVPAVSLDGFSCNLVCQGRFYDGSLSSGDGIVTNYANQWVLGGKGVDKQVTVEVTYNSLL